MTFLNPFLLLGLAAAAIPIIIHLLNLRKLRTVEFSSLRFLKELQKTKMRRVKIKQWILLALRTLMIIALVVAFSRPALRGSLAGTIGSHAKTTLVLLLDDSPSMATRHEGGVLFNQAKSAALKVLDLMKDGDEAYLVKLSDVDHNDTFLPVHSANDIKKVFESMATTQERASYRDALGVAAKLMEASKNFNKEVYLFTDRQATQFESGSTTDSTDLFADGVKVFVSEIPPGQRSNAAITSVGVQSRIITKGKPAIISLTARNFGSTSLTNSSVSVCLDGARVAQQSLDIGAGGSATTAVTVIPKRRGNINGYAQLEDDVLEFDNRGFFSLTVPDNLNIVSVGASREDARLPIIALTLDKDSVNAGLISTQFVNESQLSSIDITKCDLMVTCGVKDFSTTEAERIAQFVKSGGGLLIFPGRETDIGNYNETLFARLEIPPAQPATNQTPPPQTQESYLSFGSIDFAHPLFEGLFEQATQQKQNSPGLESPHVYSFITTSPGLKGHRIISLSNGAGFLTEYPLGAGRVLLFSVEAGLSWSDFPLKGLFVPLMYRSALYLASQNETAPTFIVGDEIKTNLRLKERSEQDAYVLRSPAGIDERIIPHFNATSGVAAFSLPRLVETGIYEIRKNTAPSSQNHSHVLQAVAVNIDPRESDTRVVLDDELNVFWRNVGLNAGQITSLSGVEQMDAAILQSRFGVELWKYFVGLALLCAFIEMIISRASKSEASLS